MSEYTVIHEEQGRHWHSKPYETRKQALKKAKKISKTFDRKITKTGNLRIVKNYRR